jgi:hypothetical protein
MANLWKVGETPFAYNLEVFAKIPNRLADLVSEWEGKAADFDMYETLLGASLKSQFWSEWDRLQVIADAAEVTRQAAAV